VPALARRSTESLDRMVKLSPEAIEKIEQFIGFGREPMDWFLLISWRKGSVETWRGEDGAARWSREPDEGWIAEFGGCTPGRVPSDVGTPLHGNVRLLIQERPEPPQPFPGGDIYVENGEFRVRPYAI
jgi:hypothetical protein